MSRLGRDKLREERFSRSRQVTGCIGLVRHCDLVKEIGQTCDRSATVRPASRTLNRRMVTAVKPVYSTCSLLRQEEYASVTTISESTCTATSLRVACDWRRDGIT